MIRFVLGFFIFSQALLPALSQQSDSIMDKVRALHWIKAPDVASIANVAEMKLNNGLVALNEADSDKFIQLNGNPASPGTYVVSSPDFNWFAIFTFDPSGYVRDDEKIDADQLLTTLKAQNEEGIAERKRLGLEPLVLEGWASSPHYDTATNRLEWGTKLRGQGGDPIVNYSIRILGRRGVMSAMLISSPSDLTKDLAAFHLALNDYSFTKGESYSEFRNGDKIAEYGLGALVVGGAAAVAFKVAPGLFKFLGLAAIALFGTVGAFFKRLFARKKNGPSA